MGSPIIEGRVWIYGDDVNTDVIFPGKYTYTVQDPADMAAHALEDLDPTFREEVRPGDIIVAGKNWGCGSSREQAVICLKQVGLGAIIATSFARIYYRNCINNALPAIVCPQIAGTLQKGDTLKIDLARGEIMSPGGVFNFAPLLPIVREIFERGGLVEFTKRRLMD
ncbi:MAG: 3-isopropylmalate dehydratase [Anaerolineales bacterium]|nr:3-isopropylmalate dehydratase [Anaerolineales bacterium]